MSLIHSIKQGIKVDESIVKQNLKLDHENKFEYKSYSLVVSEVYEIRHEGISLFFIITDKLVIIFDTLEGLFDDSLKDLGFPPTLKTGNQYPGCISMYYTIKTNNIHIDFIISRSTCIYRTVYLKDIDKIFDKIFVVLKKLKFVGSINLDDDALFGNYRICILKAILSETTEINTISIYNKYGFKIDKTKETNAIKKFKLIKELVKIEGSIDSKNSLSIYTKKKDDLESIKLHMELENMSLEFPEDVKTNKYYQGAGSRFKKINQIKKKSKKIKKKRIRLKKTKKNQKQTKKQKK